MTNYWGNANQNHNEMSPYIQLRMTIIYMASVGKNVKKLEHLCTVSGSIKLQLLHKTVWIVLSKLKIEQPCVAFSH